jgi:hypothetical protein
LSPARHRFPSLRAILIVVLLLALAAPVRAQAPDTYVKYRVEIEAPAALVDPLRSGLDLYRWQGYETMTPELLARLMTEANGGARHPRREWYFSATVRATLTPRRIRRSCGSRSSRASRCATGSTSD